MRSEVSHAIVFHQHGGADVLKWERQQLPAPGRGELQLRHTAIGVNFIDIYDRSGLYPRPLPETPGREAAGVVVALGRGVQGFKVGQRVAYVTGAAGAYSERRNIDANHLVRLPPDIQRRAGRGADAQGPDGRIPAAPYLIGCAAVTSC